MKVSGIDVEATIAHVRQQLETDKTVTPTLKLAIEAQLPLSAGSLVNFNTQAARFVEELGALDTIKSNIQGSAVVHADETGMNINGKKHWLHTTSTPRWTYFICHKKRGKEATDAAGILPNVEGYLVHGKKGTSQKKQKQKPAGTNEGL